MNRRVDSSRSAEAFPKAIIRKDHRAWLLCLAPLAAAGLCAWFAYRDFIGTGPLISVSFPEVEGLQPQNTPLLFRGVTVGAVKAVALSPDEQRVVVKIRLTGAGGDLAREGSAFWIVHPDLKIGAISGLRTLVSGEYIEIRPGPGPRTNQFAGLAREPLPEQTGALEITLASPQLGSLQEGSPVFYRGIQVGEVTRNQLAENSQAVLIQARIWREFKPLVHQESRFWNAGGLAVHFGLFKGMQISAESPKTIITGGLEFATPPEPVTPASNGQRFVLYEKMEDKWKDWTPAIRLNLPTNDPPQTTLQTNVWPMLQNP